jgi:hypothetical protein
MTTFGFSARAEFGFARAKLMVISRNEVVRKDRFIPDILRWGVKLSNAEIDRSTTISFPVLSSDQISCNFSPELSIVSFVAINFHKGPAALAAAVVAIRRLNSPLLSCCVLEQR